MRYRISSNRWVLIGLETTLLAVLVSGCFGTVETDPGVTQTPPDDTKRSQVTVSGISAGGYMAVQAHVALSDMIGGVAAVAAGPYHCADGSLLKALGNCMKPGKIDIAPMIDFARTASDDGRIANIDSLSSARVWLFHSQSDTVISHPLADGLADFYREWVAPDAFKYVSDINAAHGWPTLTNGADCLAVGGDFINACDYDTAGQLLTHLYGGLAPPAAGLLQPQTIDLSTFNATGSDILDQGFVFVPDDCNGSISSCRLHIALHGCLQSSQFVDDRFATQSGLNNWAATNQIVVVYPQVNKSAGNPNACWDWWGYTGEDYVFRSGKQIATISAIINGWTQNDLLH